VTQRTTERIGHVSEEEVILAGTVIEVDVVDVGGE
jgi:hypothetical protein